MKTIQAIRRYALHRPTARLLLAGLSIILTELLVLLAGYWQAAADSVAVAQFRYLPHLEYILVALALLLAGAYLVERSLQEQDQRK
jgi:hypothetical protein